MKKTYRAHQDSRILHLFWLFWIVAILIAALPAFADDTIDQRNAFEVSYSDAEQVISHALLEKGVGDKVSASMTSMANGNRKGVLYAFDKPVTIEPKGLQFNQ